MRFLNSIRFVSITNKIKLEKYNFTGKKCSRREGFCVSPVGVGPTIIRPNVEHDYTINSPSFLTYLRIQFKMVPRFKCTEIIWAGYMTITEPNFVNIVYQSSTNSYWSASFYTNVGTNKLVHEDTINTDKFTNTNPFISIDGLQVSGNVDGSLSSVGEAICC